MEQFSSEIAAGGNNGAYLPMNGQSSSLVSNSLNGANGIISGSLQQIVSTNQQNSDQS